MRVSRFGCLCAGLALMAFGAIAQNQGDWMSLGQTKVAYSGTKDVILAAPKGAVSAIQLRVEKAPVEILRAEIRFMSGLSMLVDVKETVEPGGATRVMQFTGRKAEIRSVEFSYVRTKWGDNRPVVSLFARP